MTVISANDSITIQDICAELESTGKLKGQFSKFKEFIGRLRELFLDTILRQPDDEDNGKPTWNIKDAGVHDVKTYPE